MKAKQEDDQDLGEVEPASDENEKSMYPTAEKEAFANPKLVAKEEDANNLYIVEDLDHAQELAVGEKEFEANLKQCKSDQRYPR